MSAATSRLTARSRRAFPIGRAGRPGLIDTQIARDVSGDEQAYGEIAKSVPHRPRRQARGDRLGRAVALQSRRELRGGRLPRLGLAIPRQKD